VSRRRSEPSGPGRASRIDVAVAIPIREGRVLVARRAPGVHLPGVWEFPGGRLEDGEEPAAAARRELREETGLAAADVEPLVVVEHDYPDRRVRLHCYTAPEPEGEVAIPGREWAWIAVEEFDPAGMPAANQTILRALERRMRG
jgi:8-oxo-dGTP diphosphatase